MAWRKILKHSSSEKLKPSSEKSSEKLKPDSLEASAKKPQEVSKKKKGLESVPPWFLENCVKTSSELKNYTPPLIINHNEVEKRTNALSHGRSGPEIWEMDMIVYEQILDIISEKSDNKNAFFTNNAAYLRFPPNPDTKLELKSGGLGLLRAVVENFAKDIEADLISLSFADIEDLTAHFLGNNRLEIYFNKGDKKNVRTSNKTFRVRTGTNTLIPQPPMPKSFLMDIIFPFDRVLFSPALKKKGRR